MDGTMLNVEVNEVACAMGAADGNRNPSPAGVRMGNQKYMITYKDDEACVTQLTRAAGGACVGKTATAVVIGFWKKDGKISDGKAQNMDDCFKLVQEMVAYLKEQGY